MSAPRDTTLPRQAAATLRHRAESAAAGLPPLLAEAEHLAANILLGEHGRRRAGTGDEFWQYRPAHALDAARSIDWRRSARSDAHFVREHEWQAAQSVVFWVDDAASMRFAGAASRPEKGARARLLALAAAILLLRGGERVGLAGGRALSVAEEGAGAAGSCDASGGPGLPPRSGSVQRDRLALALVEMAGAASAAAGSSNEYRQPDLRGLPAHGRAVLVSDFFGDPAPIERAVTAAAERGVRGVMVQVLDPVEESFPFDGRTIFESMGGSLRHETRKAGDLRARYLARLAERKDRLAALARSTGWLFQGHHTDQPPLGALVALYHALERRGRRC
ncbi:DUF58 domain-containing protein [Alkalilacustris brevis]|uniref:DUF58 domain-containing protein n=1 Tax=Alkalilacustris brevis TaxID=2026338 RepID=UPI001EE490D3|nr:DUF58 domain-containing protein [Alkalilacustris brevis]